MTAAPRTRDVVADEVDEGIEEWSWYPVDLGQWSADEPGEWGHYDCDHCGTKIDEVDIPGVRVTLAHQAPRQPHREPQRGRR